MAEEQDLRLKSRIVQSGDVVTVFPGETPVLFVSTPTEAVAAAVKAVNFIRSGAPGVSFVIESLTDGERNDIAHRVQRIFSVLAVETGWVYLHQTPAEGVLILNVTEE